jgi:hypothetical protein
MASSCQPLPRPTAGHSSGSGHGEDPRSKLVETTAPAKPAGQAAPPRTRRATAAPPRTRRATAAPPRLRQSSATTLRRQKGRRRAWFFRLSILPTAAFEAEGPAATAARAGGSGGREGRWGRAAGGGWVCSPGSPRVGDMGSGESLYLILLRCFSFVKQIYLNIF